MSVEEVEGRLFENTKKNVIFMHFTKKPPILPSLRPTSSLIDDPLPILFFFCCRKEKKASLHIIGGGGKREWKDTPYVKKSHFFLLFI